MGEMADLGPWRRLLRLAFLGGIALSGGCFPQSSDEDDSKKPFMAYSGSGQGGVNRSDKADPLLGDVTAAARNIIDAANAKSNRQDSRPVSLDDRGPQPVVAHIPQPASPPPVEIDDAPATVALENFFKALDALESGRSENAITILHLGDSHIAADRFSGDMRDQFQSRFGSAGRGMVMPGLYMSRGMKFDQGGKWQPALSTGEAPGPYGITGVKVSARGRDDWLRLTATDRPFGWAEITLQTGPGQGSALIALDGEAKLAPLAGAAPGFKTIRLEKQAREVIIRPKGDGPVTVHAIVTGEEKPGIRYVNLGIPGATAATPLSWSPAQVAQDLRQIDPSLIIIGYGTEESFDDELNPRDYESKVNAVLSMLQQAAPQASLLVIGPPDIARLPKFATGGRASDVCRALSPQERAGYAQRVRSGDQRLARWHPPLRLEDVRAALRRAAAAHRAFFWDWSKLMGGPCGVHAWVHSDPPLATGDHIYLTEEGSKRTARLLFRELMTGYEAYDRAIAVGAGGWKPAVSEAPTAASAPAPTVRKTR
jgi:hypothetical protein